jgi:hypothetical protein
MWGHVLNLFGLILVVKRLGERALERSSLDWTIIRPAGLSESETDVDRGNRPNYSMADRRQDGRIPRRLVARVCLEALETPKAISGLSKSPVQLAPGAGPELSDNTRPSHRTEQRRISPRPERSNHEKVGAWSPTKNGTGLLPWLTTNP